MDEYNELNYLTDIPQSVDKYGFCKTLAVRREVIHIKHILTEVFVRKSVDVEKYLQMIDWSIFDYMEYMTNRLRRVHHFDRKYRSEINSIVKLDRNKFFPTIELYHGLKCMIALDFDGVVTENSFGKLYNYCIERSHVEIVSANPTITKDWFDKKNLPQPHEINSCKGKIKKLIRLIEINKKYDYVFYVDNEIEYLNFAWLFGIQTYQYINKEIKHYSCSTK